MYSTYKVKLKTKKTLEQLRKQGDINFGSSEEGLKRALKYNNLIDGFKRYIRYCKECGFECIIKKF